MIPQVYQGYAPNYALTNRAFSAFEATSAIVTNELNGEYFLELSVPIGSKYWDKYRKGQVITAQIDDTGDVQKFIISDIQCGLEGLLSITAEHVSYHYAKVCVAPFLNDGVYGSSQWGFETAWANADYKSPNATITYSRSSDKQGATHLLKPDTLRSYYLNELVSMFGGEFKFDNLDIIWADRIGAHYGVNAQARAIYGQNIIELNRSESISTIPYRIYPYWGEKGSDQGYVELPEKYVPVGSHTAQLGAWDLAVDLSFKSSEMPTVSQLRQLTSEYIDDQYSNLNDVSLTISKITTPSESPVTLGDDIYVRAEPLDIDGYFEIKKMTYDVLQERIIELEAGAPVDSFAKAILER